MKPKKSDLLVEVVEHIDVKEHNVVPLVEAMSKMPSARDLGRAAQIYETMVRDDNCTIILCLAGSIFSAGLKNVIVDLVRHNMVDAIVSTGAIVVDQDFFEALGFKHYKGEINMDDDVLRRLAIDRIYDTYIDEDQLRACDATAPGSLMDSTRVHILRANSFAKWADIYKNNAKNLTQSCSPPLKKMCRSSCQRFSDCSAGFGLVHHQWHHPDRHVSIDSAKDFLELTKIKIESKQSGLFMVGGGVPKNFAQDTVVAADYLGFDIGMHKYAVQITVADVRDGALSSSTLKKQTRGAKWIEALSKWFTLRNTRAPRLSPATPGTKAHGKIARREIIRNCSTSLPKRKRKSALPRPSQARLAKSRNTRSDIWNSSQSLSTFAPSRS